MKHENSISPNTSPSKRNRHLVRMYPFIAPITVEIATAGTTIRIELRK